MIASPVSWPRGQLKARVGEDGARIFSGVGHVDIWSGRVHSLREAVVCGGDLGHIEASVHPGAQAAWLLCGPRQLPKLCARPCARRRIA